MKSKLVNGISAVNRELWLILSLFVIAYLINCLIASNRMMLGLYSLPVIFSAYFYGRRHATLTALAAVLVVVLVLYSNPSLMAADEKVKIAGQRWYDLTVWGGTLILTAYAMGTLYEKMMAQVTELRRTYDGVLMILRHFISKDKYTENHSYRVSVYASKIAGYLNLDPMRIEDVRAAALLHDVGKLDISREILYKAARLTEKEYHEMKNHVERGVQLLEPIGGSLRRVIPIILAHHDRYDGNGYHATAGNEIPLESRIISVADVWDSLTSDRPYRKAMSPFDAKEVIIKGSGTEFDPRVVDAFQAAFAGRELEVPELVI